MVINGRDEEVVSLAALERTPEARGEWERRRAREYADTHHARGERTKDHGDRISGEGQQHARSIPPAAVRIFAGFQPWILRTAA